MSTATAFAPFAEAGRLMWLTSSGNPCTEPFGGCAGRNERQATLAEWTSMGLPRTGATACQGRCYCFLLPMLDFTLDAAAPPGPGYGPETPKDKPSDNVVPFSTQGLSRDDLARELRDLITVGSTTGLLLSLLGRLEQGLITVAVAAAEADALLGLV